MKKTAVSVILLLVVFGAVAFGEINSAIDRNDLSLKAGPTEPGEKLSLVWLECYVYPKVLKGDRVISLGIRTTSKISGVTAVLDASQNKIPLTSNDGLSWGGACKLDDNISAGIHVVRYYIRADKGSVRRTVDFFVEAQPDKTAKDVVKGEALYAESWPLTVTTTCSALVGASTRILYSGEKVIGITRVPWYKVVFENGDEGWIPSSVVKEPVDEQYQFGQEAFKNRKYAEAIEYYKNVVAIDPDNVKGYLWLAKSYFQGGDYDASYRSIMEALRKDDRDMECKLFANTLAKKFYELARNDFDLGRFNEAIVKYQNVLALKPTSTLSWVEMGQCYSRLGLPSEAKTALRQALKIEPENNEIRALVDNQSLAAVSRESKLWAKIASKAPSSLPAVVADDSLQCVKTSKTQKGTKIEAAVRSVVALTKSLGTPVIEKGWQTYKQGDKLLVRYICEQGSGVLEAFEWVVDPDSKQISANNDNARLLMSRW